MKHSSALLPCVILALGSSIAIAQNSDAIEGIGPVGPIKLVKDGFQFLEGPADDGAGTLYFTDIPANTINQLTNDGNITPFTQTSGHANGLMIDAAGKLLACQMDGQLVSIDRETKEVTVLADKHAGKRFNAPNDLVFDQQGGIYFTDPLFRAPQPLPQGTQAFYYRAVDGSITRMAGDLPAPNGIALSPDEKTLYLIPSRSAEMLAFDVAGPGKLENRRVFCRLKQKKADENGGGDGMTIDTEGNLYITAGTGVQVFSSAGDYLGNITFPQQPANVTFGGADRKTLFVTARTGLYCCKMQAAGHVYPGPNK